MLKMEEFQSVRMDAKNICLCCDMVSMGEWVQMVFGEIKKM